MTLPSEGLFYPPLRRDEGKKACPRLDLGWGFERVKAFKLIIFRSHFCADFLSSAGATGLFRTESK